MKLRIQIFLATLFLFCGIFRVSGKENGTILLQDDLRDGKKWSSEKGVVFDKSGVRVIVSPESEQSKRAAAAMANRDLLGNVAKTTRRAVLVSQELPILKKYKNYMIEVSVDAKAYSVAVPKVPWEGVRFVLNYDTECLWYSECCNGYSGSFDWKNLKFRTRVPIDLTKATLSMGIIGDKGEIQFRNLKIRIVEGPLPKPDPNAKTPADGHPGIARLRGLNTGIGLISTEKYAKSNFDSWKDCNLYKFTVNDALPDCTDAEFDAFCEKSLQDADRFLYFLKKHSRALGVIQFCGVRHKVGNTETHASALEKKAHDRNIILWKKFAEHFKGEKAIWAFELYNEMEIRIEPKFDYNNLMETIARMINKIDPSRWMIVQQEAWWGQRSMDRLRPIRAKNIIYGVHHYTPFPFSHQRIGSKKAVFTYPSVIEGLKWDKEMIRKDLEPARHFQKAYNVPIFVSEFCCVSWGEGGGQWTRDCIEIFEEYGWDWMWHCIAEFQPWDPHKDANLKTAETDRSRVMKEYFAKNQFPEKFNAVKPAGKKYGPELYRNDRIQLLENYKSWKSIPLFSGYFNGNLQITLKMRLLRTDRSFGSVNVVGENDSCGVLIRPRGVSYLRRGKQEVGFRDGGVVVPLRQWAQYDILVSNGKLRVSANGQFCGEIPFVPGEITKINIGAASTDLEVKDVTIRNLGKSAGSFFPFTPLKQVQDVFVYKAPDGEVKSVNNISAWKNIPIFKGELSDDLVLSMDFRILKTKNGFGSVTFNGTNGRFMMILRPLWCNFTVQMKDPSINRPETGFPQSKMNSPLTDWTRLEFTFSKNEIALLAGGKDCGSVEFIPGKLTGISLSAAYADCEFRDVELRYRDPEKISNAARDAGKKNPYSHLTFVPAAAAVKKNPGDYLILFKGNSITRHGFNADTIQKLGWDHESGMAASSESKDYAHILTEMIRKELPGKNVRIAFGKGGRSGYEELNLEQTWQPDLIVFQGGEHWVTPENFGKYESFLDQCLTRMKKFPGSPKIILIGIWEPHSYKDNVVGRIQAIQKRLAEKHQIPFVPVESIAADKACSGSGKSGGVKWHPNDLGMRKYAEAVFPIWQKMCK